MAYVREGVEVMRRTCATLLVLALVSTACVSGGESTTTLPPVTSSTTTSTSTSTPTTDAWVISAGLELGRFGDFAPIPIELTTTYPGPELPSSLDDVIVPGSLEYVLGDLRARDLLVEHGFVVVPAEAEHFWQIYEGAGYATAPVFVTTDAAYHSWHLVFDKILREAEQQVFIPLLEEMLSELVDRSRQQASQYAGTQLEDATSRAAQFYETAATVLELDVGPIGSLAAQEVALVMEAVQYTASPVTSFGPCESGSSPANCNDYSLYKPRGHYTRNADLERYFRAMSVLGNSAFFLDSDSLQIGLMASRVLLSDPTLVDMWRRIYEPTAFLVGAADDYTPFEAATAAADVTPDGLTAPLDFADPAVVDEVAQSLLQTRRIQINPNAPSLRIMGVRFVLDSYIYDQLVHPSVRDRFTASPMDMAAAFGSDWAYDVQEASGVTGLPGYEEQLAMLQDVVESRSGDEWGSTVYDAWLYSLIPLMQPIGGEPTDDRVRSAAYPEVMRSEAWTAKSHQTAFGSYTELKHDTILYAKQAIAEGGGGDVDLSRHWVEPEPAAFRRLAAAADLLREGLVDRGLFPVGTDSFTAQTYESLLTDLIDWLERLADISDAELRGEPISTDDNSFLENAGGYLESFWIRTADWEHDDDDGPDEMAALVVDIMRNPDSVLQLGTGWVDHLLILVPDDSGTFHVAVGAVYSYYEFWQPEGDRLTDEQWRDMLKSDRVPARPAWTEVFVAPAD